MELARGTAFNIGNLPREADEVPQYLAQVMPALAGVIEALRRGSLEELNTAPDRVYTGLVVLADGTNWNPGSGQGVYCYYNSAWNYLG